MTAGRAGQLSVIAIVLVVAMWIWMRALARLIEKRRRERIRYNMQEELKGILAEDLENEIRLDIERFRRRYGLDAKEKRAGDF